VTAIGDVLFTPPVLLDLGCGTLRAGLDELTDTEWAATCAAAVANAGQMVLEKAPQDFKAKHDVFGPARPEWKVMHQIKKALDPNGVYAPGILPGRI
jgi:hypothetical protein